MPIPTAEILPKKVDLRHMPSAEILASPKLFAWFMVRQEWNLNGGRVSPELLRLEAAARKARNRAATNRNS